MKKFPQGLSGVFLTIPLTIADDLLSTLTTTDVIVNLNKKRSRTVVFEKKKSIAEDSVTFNSTTKNVTFLLKPADFANLGEHQIQVFFQDGNLFVPTFQGEFEIVENNVRPT